MQNLTVVALPSYTHRVGDKRITGFVDGLDAIRQSVKHTLSTERYAYAIYSSNRGAEMEQFIGATFSFVKSNVGRVIKEAIMQDDRIIDVIIESIEQTQLDGCEIKFDVISTQGTFREQVFVRV